MKRLNQAGRDAIEEFIMCNHRHAIYMDNYLPIFYEEAEKDDQQGGTFSYLCLSEDSSVTGKTVWLNLIPQWFDQVDEKAKIGIEDKVEPELLNKRISEW